MTYYKPYEYAERYFILFDDVDGNKWKISIQDPAFSGTAVELTGGETPVRWEGEGDEAQDEVVWGSTGNIQLVCLAGQESLFTNGQILPVDINDRRVQVLRYMNNEWAIYWQGFIKPETFSQDWDSAPYEIDLPIVSAIAASEYFELPELEDYNIFEEATSVWALMACAISILGCDYTYVYTNKPEYEDFNGVKSYDSLGSTRHWTEGRATMLDFYELSGGYTTPATVKDVLEMICYPYGKIYEFSRAIVIAISWKDSAYADARWYSAGIYNTLPEGGVDYDTILMDPQRFGEDIYINTVNLSDIATAGTDNNKSILPPPMRVDFSNDIAEEKTIFELTEDYLLPTLPAKYDNNLIFEREYHANGKQHYREHYIINISNVDKYAFTRGGFGADAINGIEVTTTGTEGYISYPFVRVAEMEATTNRDMTSSIKTPLAFLFDFGQSSGTDSFYIIRFNINRPVISNDSFNQIKLSIKAFAFNQTDALENLSLGGGNGAVRLYIKDVTVQKWLTYASGKWEWVNTETGNIGSWLSKENEDYILRFNEYREDNDLKPHVLQIKLDAYRASGEWWDKLYATLKLEYESTQVYFSDRKQYEIRPPKKQFGTRRTMASNGDNLDIKFKTKCLRSHYFMPTSPQHLANSFCDAQKYIDLQEREMIEIESAQFNLYNGVGYRFDLVTHPVVIVDGSKVFIPVAVGMNPRMNTLKLTLVSTNVQNTNSPNIPEAPILPPSQPSQPNYGYASYHGIGTFYDLNTTEEETDKEQLNTTE